MPTTRYPRRVVVLAAMLGLALPAAAHAASYRFQTLNNAGDSAFNQLLGINTAGTIAGYFGSGLAGSPNQGYTLVPPNSYTTEDYPGSAQTQVVGINNVGTTVGFWSDTNTGTDANFGFVDQGGTFTNVNNPLVSSLPAVNQLLGVNDHKVAVGFYNDTLGNSHAYTYTISSAAFSAVTPPGATSATAAAINNSGEIAGFYAAGGVTSGFLDNGGTFTTLNAPGASSTSLFGLNDNGLAVGSATIGTGLHGVIYNSVANSWQVLDAPLGINTTTFNGVNNLGQIVGFYVDAAGNTDGLLASPVPEPPAFAVLAAGLIALPLLRRRRTGIRTRA